MSAEGPGPVGPSATGAVAALSAAPPHPRARVDLVGRRIIKKPGFRTARHCPGRLSSVMCVPTATPCGARSTACTSD